MKFIVTCDDGSSIPLTYRKLVTCKNGKHWQWSSI